MIEEIANFIMTHDLGEYMFDYLFVFKYDRRPTEEEKDSFIEIWDNEYNDSSYDESLSL